MTYEIVYSSQAIHNYYYKTNFVIIILIGLFEAIKAD